MGQGHDSPAADTAVVDAAWAAYLAGLDRIRQQIYGHPYAASTEGRARANYLFHQIQAAAFNVAFGPDPRSPRFFGNLLFDPAVYTWTSPGADYVYRKAFVDGAETYRITGKRRNARMLIIQLMAAYWTEPVEEMRNLGTFELGKFHIEADGSFEIIASAQPHEGNWIELDASRRSIVIMTREVFDDWENEEASDLYIEPLDLPRGRPYLSDDDYVRRLEGATRFIDYTVTAFSHLLVEETARQGGVNQLIESVLMTRLKNTGVNPFAGFDMMKFELTPGEVVLIEIGRMDATQWTIQTSDVWHQNTNFVDHQSSLNGFQAKKDSDGVFRIVLAMEDPGVPNWLDTVGLQEGSIDFRYLMGTFRPETRCTLLPLDQLRAHLPAETPTVTPEQRRAQLQARRRGALRHWRHA